MVAMLRTVGVVGMAGMVQSCDMRNAAELGGSRWLGGSGRQGWFAGKRLPQKYRTSAKFHISSTALRTCVE